MEINGNNVFKKGSTIPVAFAVEGLAPDIDITTEASNLEVDFYAVDECKGVYENPKKASLSFNEDSEWFIQLQNEENTFAAVLDTSHIDAGRVAGEVSFTIVDDTTGLRTRPIIPFLTDIIIREW